MSNKSENMGDPNETSGSRSASEIETIEVFRLRNVEFRKHRKCFVGDLVFMGNWVGYVIRAKHVNLWGDVRESPMEALIPLVPLGFLFACAGGAVAFLFSGDAEAFDIGGIVGLIVSIPLSVWGISRINRRSVAKAAVALREGAGRDPDVLGPKPWWAAKCDLLQVTYDAGQRKLSLIQKHYTTVMSVPLDEWHSGEEAVNRYLAACQE